MYSFSVTQRRGLGGVRREASERVLIRREGFEAEAWSLNVSRGGLRIVIETPLTVGVTYELVLPTGETRPVRVVWLREESDGQIAGLEFLAGPLDKTPFAPSVK
jgi:PilZ domain